MGSFLYISDYKLYKYYLNLEKKCIEGAKVKTHPHLHIIVHGISLALFEAAS